MDQLKNSHPFIDSRLEIRHIPEINGYGVFTNEYLEVETIVETAPVVIIPKQLVDFAIWSCRAEGVPDSDLKIDQYILRWDDNTAFPQGWCGIYNHSDNPNCFFVSNKNLLSIITIKPVQAGEQLLVSYGEHWFEAKKGYVTKYPF